MGVLLGNCIKNIRQQGEGGSLPTNIQIVSVFTYTSIPNHAGSLGSAVVEGNMWGSPPRPRVPENHHDRNDFDILGSIKNIRRLGEGGTQTSDNIILVRLYKKSSCHLS